MYVHCAYPFLIYYIYIYISHRIIGWDDFMIMPKVMELPNVLTDEMITQHSIGKRHRGVEKSLEDRGQRERFVLELISGCAGIAIPEVRAAPAVARTESQDNLKAAGTKSYSHSLFPSPLTRAHKCESVYTNRNYLTPNV